MAAKGQALAIREEFLDRAGMHVTDVAEFDLAIAHLRVPEMAQQRWSCLADRQARACARAATRQGGARA